MAATAESSNSNDANDESSNDNNGSALNASSVLRLYSALGAASYGAAREIAASLAPLPRARRAALLPAVWRCLGQLLDEAAGFSLPCEAALLSSELARSAQQAALARREAEAARSREQAVQRLSEEKVREAGDAARREGEQRLEEERAELRSALAAAVAWARASEVRVAGLEAALEVARAAADEEAEAAMAAEARLAAALGAGAGAAAAAAVRETN